MQDGAKVVALAREASQAAEALLAEATLAVRRRVMVDDRVVERVFDREQRATHALAWLATYAESVRQLAAYAERLDASSRLGEMEELSVIAAAVIGGASLAGGIGTASGAIIGALIMQSLRNGMVLIGIQSSVQQLILAFVLILAVWFDVSYQQMRKR